MTIATTQAGANRLFGAIMLISGTTIGAAMLALPISTGRAGLIPSLMVMGAVWLYLVFAALCLLEVSMSMPKNANLITMAEETLGIYGKIVAWGAYLFLLYALNTAYLFGLTSILQNLTHLSKFACAVPLLVLFWMFVKRGVGFIDLINRLFMIGICATFVLLLVFAIPHIQSLQLTYDWHYIASSLPIVVCAFGYHIVIPSIVAYLENNVSQIKKAIWIGSFIPLVVYAIWQVVSLGILSDPTSLHKAFDSGLNSAQALAQVSDSSFVSGIDVSFAFFAMITSFFGVSMALFDFLKDGLKGISHWKIFAISFLPSLYFALQNERVFLTALEYAGAYGVVILLALLPACMVWSNRYIRKRTSPYTAPGGKLLLAAFILLSVALILLQVQ